MSNAVVPRSPAKNWKKIRDAWIAELEQMAADVEKWSAANDWDTKRESKEVEEDEIGTYLVPVVRIQTMKGRLYFEPVARFVLGASGRIEITATSSFWQVILAKEKGQWRFLTEDLEDLKKTWSREGFTEIANDLLRKR